MKKLLLLLAAVLLLTSCGQAKQQQQQKADNGDQPTKSAWQSIRDAMDKAITLKCEYTDEDGQVSTNYIKGKMIRTESANPTGQGKIFGLFKDEKLYLWGTENKDGMVFDLKTLAQDTPPQMGEAKVNGIDDVIFELEKNKQKCSNAVIPDSNFEIPQDINFQDLSSLFNLNQ